MRGHNGNQSPMPLADAHPSPRLRTHRWGARLRPSGARWPVRPERRDGRCRQDRGRAEPRQGCERAAPARSGRGPRHRGRARRHLRAAGDGRGQGARRRRLRLLQPAHRAGRALRPGGRRRRAAGDRRGDRARGRRREPRRQRALDVRRARRPADGRRRGRGSRSRSSCPTGSARRPRSCASSSTAARGSGRSARSGRGTRAASRASPPISGSRRGAAARRAPAPPPPSTKINLDKGRVSLAKRQTVSLVKTGAPALRRVAMGLGWDPAKRGRDIDLDASGHRRQRGRAARSTPSGSWPRAPSAARSSTPATTSPGGRRRRRGDHRRPRQAARRGPRARVHGELLPGQKFTDVRNAYCRLLDLESGAELVRYDLTESERSTGVIMSVLVAPAPPGT